MESLDMEGDMGGAIFAGCLLAGALRFNSSAGRPSDGIVSEGSTGGRCISFANILHARAI